MVEKAESLDQEEKSLYRRLMYLLDKFSLL